MFTGVTPCEDSLLPTNRRRIVLAWSLGCVQEVGRAKMRHCFGRLKGIRALQLLGVSTLWRTVRAAKLGQKISLSLRFFSVLKRSLVQLSVVDCHFDHLTFSLQQFIEKLDST